MSNYKLKVEVFKLTLNHNKEKVSDPSFRDLLHIKFSPKNDLKDNEIYKVFNKDLSNRLDNKGEYHQVTEKSKRAFSVQNIPQLNSGESYLFGVLKGGVKGDNKTSSNMTDKDQSDSLDGKVINNEHFFLIYFPLESNTGFVFFQSYPQENIRTDFITFLSRNIFCYERIYHRIKPEAYLPKELKSEFSKGSEVSQLTFTDRILSSDLSGEGSFTNGPSHYSVKVIIEPRDGKIKTDTFEKKFLEKIIGNSALGKKLEKFAKRRGKLKKGGQETAFKIGGVDEILPIVQLGSEYIDTKTGKPNYESLRKYCLNLLTSIKNDFYKNSKRSIID